MTLPPQEINKQRMRFKIFANPKVYEGPNDRFPHGFLSYIYSRIWVFLNMLHLS